MIERYPLARAPEAYQQMMSSQGTLSRRPDDNSQQVVMKRNASAKWQEISKPAKGRSRPSGVLAGTQYLFSTRFERNGQRDEPEELIAAAHAGCFTAAPPVNWARRISWPTSWRRPPQSPWRSLRQDGYVTGIHLDV